MLPQRNGLSLQSPLRPLSVLVFHLLLTHSVTGRSHLIGPSQPIVATVGDDIILPCHLEPAVDVAAMTLVWTRSDLDPEFVYVRRAGQDLVHTKHPSYKGRTSLFTDELKRGNISLKLSDVRPSDAGRYKCFIPDMLTGSFIELVFGAASSPFISLAGIDRDKGEVALQCECAGWYPEPEVLWLDGEGKLLSAGPTETVRGPDDLYTVSSRVTVEKRHNNSFTCRVQQRNINQTRETHIQVPDDFFKVQSSSSSIITGLAVSLAVCILLLLYLWKWRQNIIKTKRSHLDETETGKKKNSSQTNKTRDQSVPVEESEHLMTAETVQMKIETQRSQQQEEAEKEVQTLKEELETKKKEVETKLFELQQLHEEKQRNEDELQTVKEKLERKNKELEDKEQAAEMKWKNYEELMKNNNEELNQTKRHIDQLLADVKKLTEEKQRIEKEQQQLQKELESNKQAADKLRTLEKDLKEARCQLKNKDTEISKWQNKLNDERTRSEAAEKEVKALKKKLKTKSKTNESVPGQLGASSPTGPVIVHEVNAYGKYICLENVSSQDQQLKNWELHVQVNNSKPIKYKFDRSLRLKSGETVTMWSPGYCDYSFPFSNLEWRELKTWSPTDPVQISLINNTKETQHQLSR